MSSYIIISTFILFGLFLLSFVIYSLIKTERSAKKYRQNMKIGDEVSFSSTGRSLINCTITDISPNGQEDMVEVKVLVKRNYIYNIKPKEDEFPIV